MNTEIPLRSFDEARVLFGPLDRTARRIQEAFGVRLSERGGRLRIQGEEDGVREARGLVDYVLGRLRHGFRVTDAEIGQWIREGLPEPGGAGMTKARNGGRRENRGGGEAPKTRDPGPSLKAVKPKTPAQRHYMRAIDRNTVVFAIGPAGTGKTFLAVAAAVEALQEGRFSRIVLARPAVEAGEKLGFLPGDFYAKVNPYLRPLYDALGDLLGGTLTRKYIESDVIEVCPLAFMRGRTLNKAFILLDEAQNTTVSQMRMFLTRLGEGSKAVITGDVTQVDLPREVPSGLVDAVHRLHGVDDLAVVQLSQEDIVRDRIVQRIVEAYEQTQQRMPSPEDREANPVRRGRRKKR